MILKVLAAVVGVIIGAALGLGLMALLLWWLVPLAFPTLAFGFWNALALAGIVALITVPHVSN